MTTVCLNKKAAQQNGITIDEALLMLVIHNKANLERAEKALIQKGLITAERNDLFQQVGWRLTNKGTEVLDSVIMDSDKEQEPQDRLIQLATRLKEIFPKGKKDGTNYYWADGVALIVRRLKLFFKKYGSSFDSMFSEEAHIMTVEDFNKFVDNKIVQAAEKYVQGFNGNYQYMRLLKYFIFKEKVGANGEVEGDSELISYIENAGQEENLRNDWTSSLS
jgi:hypothetical protein